jgi:chromosome segregation ATPase
MAELMRQNAALFPDGMGSIRERMREERVDPAARRSEAVNMALIEAGLRIAGSRNPSLIGAIGEGALPAVQSYGQQLGQIRAEQRQARQDDLELAKQETNRQFAIGQISAAEYRSRMDNINANIRVNAQERGANARLAASEAAATRRAADAAAAAEAADLRRGYVSPERWARMGTEERAAVERNRTLGRPLDTSGASSALNATLQDINRIATQIDTLGPRPTRNFAEWDRNNASLQQRLRDAEARRRQLEDIVVYGRPREGAGGSASGTTNLPSGARIENGRYVPAGS